MPSSRYQQIAPRVKEICEKYGLPYNTGPFRKQWGTVQRTILRLAFPGGGPAAEAGPVRRTGGRQEARQAAPSETRAGVPVSKRKTAQRLLRSTPLMTDLAELRSNPPSLPRPHRPTPMSELSWPRKIRRVTGFMFFLSSIGAGGFGGDGVVGLERPLRRLQPA